MPNNIVLKNTSIKFGSSFALKNINLIIKKLSVLEKASREKLSWANQFSEYLQANTNTK